MKELGINPQSLLALPTAADDDHETSVDYQSIYILSCRSLSSIVCSITAMHPYCKYDWDHAYMQTFALRNVKEHLPHFRPNLFKLL